MSLALQSAPHSAPHSAPQSAPHSAPQSESQSATLQLSGDYSFLVDLVIAYESANRGVTAQPLSIAYWTTESGSPWCLRFKSAAAAERRLLVYITPVAMHADMAARLLLDVGTLQHQAGWSFELRDAHSPLVPLAVDALKDLCAPCSCLAGDADVLQHFPTSAHCICGTGWLAALQRCGSSRCPFTGQVYSSDHTPQHPSWTRWIGAWHLAH